MRHEREPPPDLQLKQILICFKIAKGYSRLPNLPIIFIQLDSAAKSHVSI